MEMPMMHRSMWHKMHAKNLTHDLDISVPSALFGVVVSTMFGMTVGMMMGKKTALKSSKYMKDSGKMGKEKWMGKEMKHHHHHGTGSPACMMKHEGEGYMAQEEQRNEGE